MNAKRLFLSARLLLTRSAEKRANYLRKKNVFHHIGENCSIMSRVVPLYPNLISIGNNVHIASDVHFITHDVIHHMLNVKCGEKKYQEGVGCIKIGDNVFVGANVTFLMNVNVGDNVVIGANSLVAKDIPSNSVVGGVPAKVISDFESFAKKKENVSYPNDMKPVTGREVSKELEEYMWNDFLVKKGLK